MSEKSKRLITPEEAARRLGLDQVTKDPHRVVLGMARRSEIRGVRVGKWTMIDPDSLDDFIAGKG